MVKNNNIFGKLGMIAATVAATTSLALGAPSSGLIKPVTQSTGKHVDKFSIDINGKQVFTGSQVDKGNNYADRANYLKPVFKMNKISRERAKVLRDGKNYARTSDKKFYPVQDTGKILSLLNPNGKSNDYDISVTIKDKKTGNIVEPRTITKPFTEDNYVKSGKKTFDYYKLVDAVSGKVINTHPGFRVEDGKNYSTNFIKQVSEVEGQIKNRIGGWITLNSINSKFIGQNKNNSDKGSFYVQKGPNGKYLNNTIKNLNNGKTDMVFLQTIRPKDFAKYMKNYKSVDKSQVAGLIGVILAEDVATNLPDFTITGDSNVSKSIKNSNPIAYEFDLNLNGVKESLELTTDSTGKYFVKSTEGNNTTLIELDKARYFTLRNLRFAKESEQAAANGYAMTSGTQGKEVVEFLFNTNKYSSEKYCLADRCSEIKFKTLEGLITSIDATANLSERADYINKKVFQAYEAGNLDTKTNNKVLEAYSSTFGQDVATSIVALNFVLGSAVYTTLTHDYLPTVEANKALARARGANDAVNLELITSNVNVNVNVNDVVKAYNNTKSMYGAQFSASEKKINEVKF